MFDSNNDLCEKCGKWFPAVEEIEPEKENSKTIEWYEAQVKELKDIRKAHYEILGDTANGNDAYFPDLVERVFKELKDLKNRRYGC